MFKKIAAGATMSVLGIAGFAMPALAANNVSFDQIVAMNHDINVINTNSADVTNTVVLSATTGGNSANGGMGGNGGAAGSVSSVGDANSANGGAAGDGGEGGSITTGDADVFVEISNSVNDSEIDVSASSMPNPSAFFTTDLSDLGEDNWGNVSVDQSFDHVARVNVTNSNAATLGNTVVAAVDTGTNVSDGGMAGNGGDAGTVSDSGEANSADGSTGGAGGMGGTISTGASSVTSAMVNIINRHVLRINQ